MNTTTKMILGIAVAAAAGAAIGMLMAPERGSDLQKRIKVGASDLINEFSTLLVIGKELASEFEVKALPYLEEKTSEQVELGV
jgi:gas vesicle protein